MSCALILISITGFRTPIEISASLWPPNAGPPENSTYRTWLLDCVTRDVTQLGLDRDAHVPLLAPVLGIDPSAGYEQAATEGRKLEEQVAQAVLDYVVAAIDGRPAIVVAENLHWFDDASRALLADVLRTGPASVLVVATSRRPERGRWETIELRPLTLAGRLALIDALEEGLSDGDRLALAARSDGIPLYVEELVRAGAIHDPARTGGAPVPGSVPEALYEPLVARLYATPDALEVAAAAAAAGQQVQRSLLAETMPIAAQELDSALTALVDAEVLQPVDGARYQFRHELLREVAYELQPPSLRRKVHDRLCDLLAREESSDWHVVALHCERAERFSEAAAAYEHTAEWARRRGALDEARGHLTRAIDLVLELTDDPTRDHREIQLRLRRGFLATTMEGAASAEAAADFDRCLELAGADPGGDDMFATLICMWGYRLGRGELDRAHEVVVALRDWLVGEREFFRPHNRGGFGILRWFSGDFAAAAEDLAHFAAGLADEGAASGEEVVAAVWFMPNDATAATTVHLALAQFMVGDVARADESIARALAFAAPLDFPQGPWSASYALWLGSWMWLEAGRFDLADRAAAELRESSARHGFDSWELFASTHTAALEAAKALRSGVADATALSAHADELSGHIEVWNMLELRIFVPFYLTTIGALLAAAGDAAAARERYDESLRLAAETGMRFYDAETMRRLAQLEPDRAMVVAALRRALELARSQAARPFELRIALDLHDLLGDEARPLLTQAMQAFADDAAAAELDEARSRVPTPR